MTKKYFDEKFDEIPTEIKEDAIEYLKKRLSVEDVESLRALRSESGESSWSSAFHFGWGMGIRNELRNNVCSDDKLPDKNWDDYYVQLIDVVIGVREYVCS